MSKKQTTEGEKTSKEQLVSLFVVILRHLDKIPPEVLADMVEELHNH